jgi:hypothetical protein
MAWQQWVLVAYFVWSVMLVSSAVGKPRKPIDGGVAATAVIMGAILTGLTVSL